MTIRATLARIAVLALASGALSGCDTVGSAVGSVGSSVGGMFSHQADPEVYSLGAGVNPRKVAGTLSNNPAEKPKVLPVASQDINCPEVEIAYGGASLRSGGPENPSVRYQFNIEDTARECN